MRLKASINRFALLAALLMCGILFLAAFKRLSIDPSPMWMLPAKDAAVARANPKLAHDPSGNQVAVDITSLLLEPARLAAIAEMVDERLGQSGLFEKKGSWPMPQGLRDLEDQVVRHLPLLFSTGQLQRQVTPLLTDHQIRYALAAAQSGAAADDGNNRVSGILIDPLGLRHIPLARMADPHPMPGPAMVYSRIILAEEHRLRLLATPASSITDTSVTRSLTRFLDDLQRAVNQQFGDGVSLTSANDFLAAPDHGRMARGDVLRTILWTTVGIGMVLLACFSRAHLGLLALLPAMAGTSMAFFVFSWIHDSLSSTVLGFGGAIMAVCMNPGMATLYLLDRRPDMGCREAVREIRPLSLPAVLSGMLGFGVLTWSGVAVFEQLGWIAAMGIGFSFLFVQTLFPRILPAGSQAAPVPRRHIVRFVDRLTSTGMAGLVLALLTAVVLSLFIRPPVTRDQSATSSTSQETRAAGNRTDIHLVIEAPDLAALRSKNDRLLEYLDTETHAGSIEKTIPPSLFFPGHTRRMNNYEAWRQFWTDTRIQTVSLAIQRQGGPLGLAHSAHDSFLKMVTADPPDENTIPASVQPLLGISRDAAGGWRQVTRITPREHFDSQHFYDRMSDICSVHDPTLSSERTGRLYFGITLKMLLLTAAGLVFLMALFLADVWLLFISLLPLAFALVCTLGSLGVIDRPWGLPASILCPVILGLGAGVPLFMVRAYQRYQRFDHPDLAVVRMAGFSTAGAAVVGFGVLPGAGHAPLNAAGWILFLGMGYCLVGSLLILPPLLKRRFERAPADTGGFVGRYRNMAPYPRMITRCRLRTDPLLDELAPLVPNKTDMANILDVGCGYGLPACWLADRYPTATIHGIEPKVARARVAELALDDRGRIAAGRAPDLPPMDVLVDMAVLLDVSHCLQDWELEKTLERIHERLLPGGCLIMRSLLPPPNRLHWTRRLAQLQLRIDGLQACYRSQAAIGATLGKCGFEIRICLTSGNRGDRVWHVSRPR